MAKRDSYENDDDFLDEEIADWDDDEELEDREADELESDADEIDDDDDDEDDLDASDDDEVAEQPVSESERKTEPPSRAGRGRSYRAPKPSKVEPEASELEDRLSEEVDETELDSEIDEQDDEIAVEPPVEEEEIVYPPDDDKALAALRKLRVRLDVNDKGNVWRAILDDNNGKDPTLILLKGLPALKELWLLGTKVTPGAADAFKEEHPKIKVYS